MDETYSSVRRLPSDGKPFSAWGISPVCTLFPERKELFSYLPLWLAASALRSGVVAYAAGDRMAARRAVPVRRRRSLTGIDSRDAAGGRGLRSPSPPTTPYPALGQPSLTRYSLAGSAPLPPLCRAAAGYRPPAVPRKRGTSVRPASELPPLRGGDLLRALPRLHQQGILLIFFHKCQSSLDAGQEKRLSPY